MSEKIFALLLRVYPARFRQRYQAEALQLLHDRLRDERGFLPRLRLWIDLLVDLLAGLPRAHRNAYALPATQVARGADSLPAFRTLDEEPLRPGSILLGGLLGTSALVLFAILMNQVPAFQPFAHSNGRLNPSQAGAVRNPDVQSVAKKLDAEFQAAMMLQECGFERVGLLPGNLGYVKIDKFADPAGCGNTTAELMGRLNGADAVIFDLRDCTGGDPEMLRFMAARLALKPVFLLTSSHTFAGSKHVGWNLKLFRDGTIVGEATAGGSYAGSGTPMRQISHSSREGAAVNPDVQVKASDALDTAEELALNAIQKR